MRFGTVNLVPSTTDEISEKDFLTDAPQFWKGEKDGSARRCPSADRRPRTSRRWLASGNSSQAVTETTCLALLAIAGGASPARDRGLHLLTNLQNTDGS